jgi:hypothetical protein
MGKLLLTGQNLGRVFYSRIDHICHELAIKLFALAPLGEATQNRTNTIFDELPKGAKASRGGEK